MGMYNKNMEKLGLRVRMDREAYPGMFHFANGHLLKTMTGTVIELPNGNPMYYGGVKVKFDHPEKFKALGFVSCEDERWIITGALSEIVGE